MMPNPQQRINEFESSSSTLEKEIVKVVDQALKERLIEIGLEDVKVIVKEIVILPCQYCGSLMPQTSTFCPHCGARRKS